MCVYTYTKVLLKYTWVTSDVDGVRDLVFPVGVLHGARVVAPVRMLYVVYVQRSISVDLKHESAIRDVLHSVYKSRRYRVITRYLISAARDDRPAALCPHRLRIWYAHRFATERNVLLPPDGQQLTERHYLGGHFNCGQYGYGPRALALADFRHGLHPKLILGTVDYPGRFVNLDGRAEYFFDRF